MKVLFDLNILIDFYFNRLPWADHAGVSLSLVASERCQGLLCATAIDHLHYLGRRMSGLDKARRAVEVSLQLFEIAPVDAAILKMALAMQQSDFEDNIVIASGVRAGCELICSRDASGFRAAPVPVVTAKDLAEQLH
jgi:predicted nucleic acid-binding protein